MLNAHLYNITKWCCGRLAIFFFAFSILFFFCSNLSIYFSFCVIPFSRILLMASCKYFCSCMPCIARTRSRHIADAGMKTCRSRTMLKTRVIERESGKRVWMALSSTLSTVSAAGKWSVQLTACPTDTMPQP